jgi:glycosyltransferase involved in cell wall biosynthesis
MPQIKARLGMRFVTLYAVACIMKLVIVNRFFYPDLAPTGLLASDVAFDLASRGREVHVVTNRYPYDGGASFPSAETIRGVRVHRVWTTRFGRGALVGRALDYASFYLSTTWKLFRLLGRGDILIAKTDPPLISVLALFACRRRGAKLVNWLEDLFPEIAQNVGMGFLKALKPLRDASVRGAAANVVLGPRMQAQVQRLVPGARVAVISNWSDGVAIRPLPFKSGEFVVGYSGNFGRAHEADTVLRTIEMLPEVSFRFTGGGHHFSRLPVRANVVRQGYVPSDELCENLAAAHVHLVTLLPQLEGLIMPSKLFAAMAAGRPVVFVGDIQGEVASVLQEHRCGVSVAAGDARGLADAILRLKAEPQECAAMGARARAAFEKDYDKPVGLARWRSLIDEVDRKG